jgi:hypothetical protein
MSDGWSVSDCVVKSCWFIGGVFFAELKTGKIIASKNILKDDQEIIRFLIGHCLGHRSKPAGFFARLRYAFTGRME